MSPDRFKYVTKEEGAAATQLVERILAAGYEISVNDGDTVVVKRSSNADTILDALASTDEDYLYIMGPAGRGWLGAIWLVWGNSAEELVADYTANEAIEALVNDGED